MKNLKYCYQRAPHTESKNPSNICHKPNYRDLLVFLYDFNSRILKYLPNNKLRLDQNVLSCLNTYLFVKMLIRTLIYIFASNRFSLAYRWRRDISFAASSTDWLFSISPPSIPSSFFLFNRLCRVICWRLISNWLGLKLYKYEELNLSYINICTLWYYTYIV